MNEAEFGDTDYFYEHCYEGVLRTGIVGKAQDRTHVALERRVKNRKDLRRVLEVGAGRGEHFDFVSHDFDGYLETDIRESEHRVGHSDVRREYGLADAQELEFADGSFDRVVATCLLLHLPDPEAGLREWRRVVREGGVLTLLVPCDPGAFVRFTRQLVTVPAVKRSGFEGYKLFNARDHRNHVGSIDQMIRYVFRKDDIKVDRYPSRLPSWNLNAYFVYTISRGSNHE